MQNTYHSSKVCTLYSTLSTSKDGLTTIDATKRLSTYGYNELPPKKKNNLIRQFLAQFNDFMVITLIIAAVISFIASILEGNADYVDPIIILTIIIFNAIIGLIQESKARHCLDDLKKLSAPYASVLRDSLVTVIPSKELVPGDIVLLEAGNYVPADIRLIDTTELKIDESSLTGESMPINKTHTDILTEHTPLAERKNMAYSSTIVTSGHGLGMVVSTGSNTEVGKIAKIINEGNTPPTPLEKNLAKTSKYLGIIALIICFIIFIIGVIQGRGLFDMFMTSISLAVASIPEGLPIIVTIVLSIGVSRMASKNAIIRTLPAVETLGSATYVCSDKTGTLTENKMTVTKICNASGEVNDNNLALSLACLCNNCVISVAKDYMVHGEPTESALIYAGLNNKINKNELEKRYPRIYEIPFNSKRKLMTTVHKSSLNGNAYRYITKGALEMLLGKCTNYYNGVSIVPLTSTLKKQIKEILNSMTKDALRVIAIAFKDNNTPPNNLNDAQIESNLCFVGLIGMIDPPRAEAYDAVQSCFIAGITPVMITGDHPNTALAIADKLGIVDHSSIKGQIITGIELDHIPDEELTQKVKDYRIFARVSPAHKVRIVKALQKNNEIVAMTGDGINDAPALKVADIGCSMGINGTDVAKNASDMILADDNFATIVTAIKQGRGIYENIRKSIHFLLSCNIGEIITILFAIIFSLPTPLLAVQLLWINLVTDSLPAISLGIEPIPDSILAKKHGTKNNFFTKSLVTKIVVEGFLIGLLTLIAFIIGYKLFPMNQPYMSSASTALTTGRTMAFATLGLSQLFHAFNMKSDTSILSKQLFNNKKLLLSFIICVFLQVSVISIPSLSHIFKVVSLDGFRWVIVLILSSLPIPIVELQKHNISHTTKNTKLCRYKK